MIKVNLKKYVLVAMLLLSSLSMAQIRHVQRSDDHRAPAQYQADCAAGISLSSCGSQPVSKDCEPGKHWSLVGTGYAHCVLDDMACPTGTRLEHDNLGNPHCQPIVCPAGTILHEGQCIPNVIPQPPPPVANPLRTLEFDGGVYITTARYMVSAGHSRPYYVCLMFKKDGTWDIYHTQFYAVRGSCGGIPNGHNVIERKLPEGALTIPYGNTQQFTHIYSNKAFHGSWTNDPSLPYEYSIDYYNPKSKNMKTSGWRPVVPSISDSDTSGLLFNLNQFGETILSRGLTPADYFTFGWAAGWPTRPSGFVYSSDSDWVTLKVRVIGHHETVVSARLKFSSLFTSDGRVGN